MREEAPARDRMSRRIGRNKGNVNQRVKRADARRRTHQKMVRRTRKDDVDVASAHLGKAKAKGGNQIKMKGKIKRNKTGDNTHTHKVIKKSCCFAFRVYIYDIERQVRGMEL